MHLAIDASNIRQGGGVTHLSQLLRAAEPGEVGITQITVWACSATLTQLPAKPWLTRFSPAWTEGGLLQRMLGQQFLLGREMSRRSCDVLFSPGGTMPFHTEVPVVTMSQNMLPFEPGEAFYFGRWSWMRLKFWLLRHSQGRSFKKADGLIFLTQYARETVSSWLGSTPSLQALVPHGIETRFAADPKPQRPVTDYTFESPFTFLYVSILMPYKHQIEVAKAASELRRAGYPVRVRFVGAEWGWYGQQFRETLRQLDPKNEFLIWPGSMPFSALHAEYQAADAFIFASSCENLPNILIEAMTAGLPIACSSVGPMPEILRNAGLYFDPSQSQDIAKAMRELINNADLRRRVALQAKELSRVYSWRRCAKDTFYFIAAVATRRLKGKSLSRSSSGSSLGCNRGAFPGFVSADSGSPGQRSCHQSMKLLIVSQYFWPENFRINDLAAALKSRGHDVTVLTGIPNYPDGQFFKGYGFLRRTQETWQGVEIVRSPLFSRGRGGGVRLGLNYLSFAWFASIVARFRLRGTFDAIFVFEVSPITVGIPAIVASRRFNAPILFWVLDLWPESLTAAGGVRSPRILRAVDRLVKWVYRNCSRVLVQSRAFVPEIARHGVPDSKIRYFPSWGESLFQPLPQADLALLPLLPEGFKVLFAGNIGEAQDLPAVLQAAERLRERADIHWLIVGDGRMAAWAKNEVQRRGLSQVHFLGRHPLEAMPHFYAAADALLLPLKREPIFALTIPGKLQSYLACARPILAMLDGEGARIVQESGAGLACAAGDAEGLAERVLKLAAMPEAERQAMGRNGRQYYETNFDRTRLFDQLESWLDEAIQESNHSK